MVDTIDLIKLCTDYNTDDFDDIKNGCNLDWIKVVESDSVKEAYLWHKKYTPKHYPQVNLMLAQMYGFTKDTDFTVDFQKEIEEENKEKLSRQEKRRIARDWQKLEKKREKLEMKV